MLFAAVTPAQDRYNNLRENRPLTAKEIDDLSAQPLSLFGPDTPLKLTVSSGFTSLLGRGEDAEYREAKLTVYLGDSLSLGFDMKLRPRGNTRLEACYYPPLKVNFPKRRMRLSFLEGLDKIKVVGPCFTGDAYRDLVLREYLVYRLYSVLTPKSFQVRLIQQKWHDTLEGDTVLNAYGFIIEEEEWLEERLNVEEIKDDNLSHGEMDPYQSLLVSLFAYMVGNHDWSVEGRHNIKIFDAGDGTGFLPVPYDFDFSNLVNARYPRSGGPIPDIPPNPRLYKGPCPDEDILAEVLKLFRDNETELRTTIEQFSRLPDVESGEMLDHIDSFMRIVNSPARVKQLISGVCQ